jgi:RNA polymerase sigma-70 factor, ECF subfamily
MEKKLLKTWEELNDHLLFFIRKRIKNKEDAEDILQDVYIKLHKNINNLNDEKKIVSWIYQITRNTINDCYKKCYRLKKVEFEEYHIELTHEEEENLNDEILISMKKIIEELPKDSKELIKLYEFEDMSHKEISKKLEIKENTSKSRLKRAKEKLKNQLDECCVFQIDKFGNVLDYRKK